MATTWPSDGTPENIQNINDNNAEPGDTITLPGTYASPQSFTWTGGVNLDSGVSLQGGGSGRVVARSVGEQTVGTGEKTFILSVSTKLPWFEAQKAYLVPGVTIRADRTGGEQDGASHSTGLVPYMIGTVTSYNAGTNTLVMESTSYGEEGTHVNPIWIISSIAATTIVKDFVGNVINTSEDTTYSAQFSGIRFTKASGDGDFLQTYPAIGGKPIMVHDCYFRVSPGMFAWDSQSIRGLCWNCSFLGTPIQNAGQGIRIQTDPSYVVGTDPTLNTWVVASMMGTADTTGLLNFYVENCDYHGMQNGNDFSDNARGVVRYCMFNNAATSTHGADTGIFGQRHLQVYQNEFVFNGFANGQTLPIIYFVYLRGGTAIVAENILPVIGSTDFQFVPQIDLQLQNLRSNRGTNGHWGDNIGISSISGASVANPTLVTTLQPHLLSGVLYSSTRIRDSDSTPNIDGAHFFSTVIDPTHFNIPVNVTVAATTGVSKRIYYPCPRQVGRGNLTYPLNSGLDGKGRSIDPFDGLGWPGTYVGDLEPVYIWNNSGGNTTIAATEGQDEPTPTYPDVVQDYLILNRDFYSGVARPGWSPYQYPNPNRTDLVGFATFNNIQMRRAILTRIGRY